ncbi:hypothetical protein N0V88_003571 [Collariella sp. IMI 366227]|nr:hypothetical protein N0V88_003571 [Collariella sp. IMI 366227]
MNIGFPGSLLPIRGQKFKDFPLRFWVSKQQTFSLYHQNYLTMHEHPLTDKFLHSYAEKKRKRSLWVYVQGSSGTDSSNTVVRRSCERMFKTALFRALEAAGFEASGRKMGSHTEALHGTIRIYLQEPKAAMKVDFDSLVQYLTKLINNATPQLIIKSSRPK